LRRNQSIKDQLDATFERVKRIDIGEIELQADFARYLCVQVSGFLEQSVRNATTAYASNRADKCVANYVTRSVNRLTNLDSEKIKEHLLKFDQSWEAPLNALLADEVKDAINSVVALRHQIAHGQPADITIGRILGYYNKISRVVVELEKLLQVDEFKAH
jgi:hypothetical protein